MRKQLIKTVSAFMAVLMAVSCFAMLEKQSRLLTKADANGIYSLKSDYITGTLNTEPANPQLSTTTAASIDSLWKATSNCYMITNYEELQLLAEYTYAKDTTTSMEFVINSEAPIVAPSTFGGIGSKAHPFRGKFVGSYGTANTIELDGCTALFRYLSSNAVVGEADGRIAIRAGNKTIDEDNNVIYTLPSYGGLAQVLVAEGTSMVIGDGIKVDGNVDNKIPSSAEGGELSHAGLLFGNIINNNTDAFTLSFNNTVQSDIVSEGVSVTASGKGNAALIAGNLTGKVNIDITNLNLGTLSCMVEAKRGNVGEITGCVNNETYIYTGSNTAFTLSSQLKAAAGDAGIIIGSVASGAKADIRTSAANADRAPLTFTYAEGGSVSAYRYFKTSNDIGGNAGTVTGGILPGATFAVGAITVSSAIVNGGHTAGGAFGLINDSDVSCVSANINSGTITGASYCGGYVGRISLTSALTPTKSAYTLADKNITVGATSTVILTPAESGLPASSDIDDVYSTAAGGLFGMLKMSAGAPVCNIDYSAQTTRSVNVKFLKSAVGSCKYSVNVGGIMGIYSSDTISNTLNITATQGINLCKTQSAMPSMYTFGGAIGTISSESYCSFSNFKETSPYNTVINAMYFGGLVGRVNDGAMVKADNVTVDGSFITTDSASVASAVVGYTGVGTVLQLSGSMILTDHTYSRQDGSNSASYYGQIVGYQENSLIFADSSWTLTRSAASVGHITDDIGNYGAIIKNGALNNLITVGSDRSVTVSPSSSFSYADSVVSLANSQDYAALAITLNSRGNFSAVSGIDTTNYKTLIEGTTIKLTGDFSLENTGIESLTRNDSKSDPFKGTFDGNSKTLTIAAGDTYSETAAGVGNGNGGIVAHKYNGIFASCENATFKNLTLNGKIYCEPVVSSWANFSGREHYAGGLVGYSTGSINATGIVSNIKINEKLQYGDNAYGGLYGYCKEVPTATVTGCTSNTEIIMGSATGEVSSSAHTGGLIGYIYAKSAAPIDFSNTTINTVITQTGDRAYNYARTGGLVATISQVDISLTDNTTFDSAKISSVNLSGLSMGETTSVSLNTTYNNTYHYAAGGLLGYTWRYVDVNITGKSGTDTVNGTLSVSGGANYGGLVYSVQGKMTIGANAVIKGTFTGSYSGTFSSDEFYDGLIVCNGQNLYLVVKNGADFSGATISNGTTNRSDMLVGANIVQKSGTAAERGGIVTIETGGAVGEVPTSETSPWFALKNPNTRYYYNIETLDKDNGSTYRTNIGNAEFNGAGDVLLWHIIAYTNNSSTTAPYWYFNTTTHSGYTFKNNIDMSGKCLYPTTITGITFNFANKKLTFGSSGFAADAGLSNSLSQNYMINSGLILNSAGLTVNDAVISGNTGKWDGGSGALVTGTFSGSYKNGDLNQPVIAGLNITGLQINELRINGVSGTQYSPLLINKVNTCVTANISEITESYAASTPAGSSLIGTVGSSSATNLKFAFKDIKLEGAHTAIRANQRTTVFTKATLFDSINYVTGKGNFAYNFYLADDWTSSTVHPENVTYGSELYAKNTEYYDAGSNLKVNPSSYPTTSLYNFTTNYRPYVADSTNRLIDVNIKSGDIVEGYGTYAKPYIIKTTRQMFAIAQYINNATAQDGWQVNYPDGANDNARHSAANYNTMRKSATAFEPSTAGARANVSANDMRSWMQQAYYKIDKNIDMSSEAAFIGIGTETYPFCGVFVGDNTDKPTVTMPPEDGIGSMGFITASYGGVVKDINIDYKGAYSVSSAATSYFGGVIGKVLGGDNIIDGVSVTFSDDDSVTPNIASKLSVNSYVTPVGGYVGYVMAGGVVFRNITDTVGATIKSGTTTVSDSTGGYYYANKYVGRVLDGYAVAENCNIDNTDKNYKIANLGADVAAGDKVTVTGTSPYNFSIGNATQMFAFAAAVNSGSMAVNTNSGYSGDYARVRISKYSSVGAEGLAASNADYVRALKDNYVISTSADSVSNATPYMVYNYFTGSAASRINTAQCSITLAENGTYNLSSYGNGFRGFGGRYTGAVVLTLADNGTVAAFDGNGSTVTVSNDNIQYFDSTANKTETYVAQNFGLINTLKSGGSVCTIKDVTLSGTVKNRFNNMTGGSYKQFLAKSSTSVLTESTYSSGMLVGLISNAGSCKVGFNNVSINNADVASQEATGGIVGIAKKPTDYMNCKYEHINVAGKTDVGGIVGLLSTNSAMTFSSDKNLLLTNAAVIHDSTEIKYFDGIGGIVGANLSAVTVGNAKATDANNQVTNNIEIKGVMVAISVYNAKSTIRFAAGGVLGCASASTTVQNVKVTDAYIQGSNGFIIKNSVPTDAQKQSLDTLYKVSTNPYTAITQSVYADNFAKFLGHILYMRNSNKGDTGFISDYYTGGAGGIVGSTHTNDGIVTTFTDCDIDSTANGAIVIITGNNSAGILGECRTNIAPQFTNCSFHKSGAGPALVLGGARSSAMMGFASIKSNGTTGAIVTNCTVGNTDAVTQLLTTTQADAYAAGFVATASKPITVTDSSITNTRMAALNVVGGVIGQSDSSFTANNIEVNNCSIYGPNAVGGIAGLVKGQAVINNIKVSNTVIEGIRTSLFTSANVGGTVKIGGKDIPIYANSAGFIGVINNNLYGNNYLYKNTTIACDSTSYYSGTTIHNSTGGLIGTTDNTRCGMWLGTVASSSKIEILGVSRSDTSATKYPYPDIVSGTPAQKSIVSANYNATAISDILTNPKLNITGTDWIGDSVQYGKASSIYESLSWWKESNIADYMITQNNFKKYSDYDNVTDLSSGTDDIADMPLLFVTGSVNDTVMQYVNMLTNGGFTDWVNSGYTVSVNTKTLDVSNNVLSDNNVSGSIVYDNDSQSPTYRKFKKGDHYDKLDGENGGGTFSLLTIKFTNITAASPSGEAAKAYTLTVPFYYPQILQVESHIVPLEYEEYNVSEYLGTDKSSSVNIASGSVFSLYIEYAYNEVRLDDDWNFRKIVRSKTDIGEISNNVEKFAAGTTVKLIDLNSPTSAGYKTYYYTVASATAEIPIDATHFKMSDNTAFTYTNLDSVPTLATYNHISSLTGEKVDDYGLERYLMVVELGSVAAEKDRSIYHIYSDVEESHSVKLDKVNVFPEATVSAWKNAGIRSFTTTITDHDNAVVISQSDAVQADYSVDITYLDRYVQLMNGKIRYGVFQSHLENSRGKTELIPSGTIITLLDSSGNVLDEKQLVKGEANYKYIIDQNLIDENLSFPLGYTVKLDFSHVITDVFTENFTDETYRLCTDFYITPNQSYPQAGIKSSAVLNLSYTAEHGAALIVNAYKDKLTLGINQYEPNKDKNAGYIEFTAVADFSKCSNEQIAAIKAANSKVKLNFQLYKKTRDEESHALIYTPVTNRDSYLSYLKANNGSDIPPNEGWQFPQTTVTAMGDDLEVSQGFNMQFKVNDVNELTNYKLLVTLTAEDGSGNPIELASETVNTYFIFTFARIYTKID